MRKAKRGFGEGRIVTALLVGSFAIALAGCGGEDGDSTAGAATSSTSSTTPTTVADTAPATSTGSSGAASGTTGGTSTTTPPPTGGSISSVTLGWVPPTQNTNGTTITNLAGYKIHYGTQSGDYTQTVALDNAGLTRYVVDNLASGTYYFAITAYNSQGVESALSGEISTTVD